MFLIQLRNKIDRKIVFYYLPSIQCHLGGASISQYCAGNYVTGNGITSCWADFRGGKTSNLANNLQN